MTEVNAAAQAAQAQQSQGQSKLATADLAENFDTFLVLLTEQLKNQDPLDPLDSAEYTNQLVQYSSVEQAIKQNQNLEEIIASLTSNQSMSYVSYIGNEVTADASTTTLSGSQASWSYNVAEDATGTFEIRNTSGSIVYSGDIELAAGDGTFYWNGQTDSGQQAVNGLYTISFDVKDASSRPETVKTTVSGIVDSVDWSSGEAVLKVGSQEFPVSSVVSVARPS